MILILQLTPIGTTIFQGVLAKDKDIGINGLVEYAIVLGNDTITGLDRDESGKHITSEDGYGYFVINLPHQGHISVNRSLDYEKVQRYYVTIVATVSNTLFKSCCS